MKFFAFEKRWIFSIFCILIFIFMENPSIWAKLQHTNIQAFSFSKSFVLLCAEIVLFLCILFSVRSFGWYKFFVCLCLSLSTLIFDVYFYVSGKVIEFQEFLLLYQSKANLLDAIEMYKMQLLQSLPRILMLWIGVYLSPPPSTYRVKIISCCVSTLLFFSLVMLVFVTCIFRQGAATNKLPQPISLYGLSLAYFYDSIKNSHIYKYEMQGLPRFEKSEYQNIILIVDESVRWDYSPFLRVLEHKNWNIFDYGCATSYANASATSNVLLRKGARFESLESDFYDNPLIWDYARKAGYITYLYDNQGRGVGHDYFDSKEREMIDFNISNSVFKDADIWKQLSYLNGSSKTFTLIIKRGSHFPYRDFPKDQKIDFALSVYQNATFLRKQYLKSIIFQSDDFWREFFNLAISKPTLIIYTSDHGQNLQDTEGLTHGTSGKKPYVGEGLVPLVVLTNIKDHFAKNFDRNFNHASHFNIFPTLIESMGYSLIDLEYSHKNASLRNAVMPIQGFFYGIPFGYFGKKADFMPIAD